jgi:hypothetical protein
MMIQCLDRFCCNETFGAKSLKTKLQLKRYKVLKFQGLDCKYTGVRSEFTEKLRASVQDCRIYCKPNYFSKEKSMNRAHGPWTGGRFGSR